MVGEMKRIFCLLCLLTCVGASHAATMCVPDLSTCESCTDGTYSGYTWSANCCGIPVSGVALPYMLAAAVSLTVSLDDAEAAAEMIGGSNVAALCVMLKPVVASNGFVGNCIGYPPTSLKAAEECARYFIPKCVFSQCTSPYVRTCGSGGGGN